MISFKEFKNKYTDILPEYFSLVEEFHNSNKDLFMLENVGTYLILSYENESIHCKIETYNKERAFKIFEDLTQRD